MRIIKNNVSKTEQEQISKFPLKVICENCESEIELDEEDVEIGHLGLYKFVCPCCGKTNCSDDGINLKSEDIRFPQHYYSFKGGASISNSEVDRYVKNCIKSLRESDDKNFYNTWTGSGDTFVSVTRYDGDEEFSIHVAKGYYETQIPYTEEDKEKWCE